jgi:hypothetical protein
VKRRLFIYLFVFALLLGNAAPVEAQLAGEACSGAFKWTIPDNNTGYILQCVSSVWTPVTQPIAAAGSTGYVQFNSSNAMAADSNFFWDNTNKRLGIGTATPGYNLHVVGNIYASGNITCGGSCGGASLPSLTSGYIWVGNGSNVATGVAVSGDITITNAGVTAIGSGKVTNAMLAGSIDLTAKVTGALPVANGGTGATTLRRTAFFTATAPARCRSRRRARRIQSSPPTPVQRHSAPRPPSAPR